MLSVRSGWPRGAVLRLTIREASWLIAELDRIEEQREIRQAEAYHNPGSLKERLETAATPGQQGRGVWGKLAAHMAETGQLTPEKSREIQLKNAAVEFLEAKRGRS